MKLATYIDGSTWKIALKFEGDPIISTTSTCARRVRASSDHFHFSLKESLPFIYKGICMVIQNFNPEVDEVTVSIYDYNTSTFFVHQTIECVHSMM